MFDIKWHNSKDEQPKRQGDYLIEVVVDSDYEKVKYIHTEYVYWDGESNFMEGSILDKMYLMDDIICWAYDGDDV